MYTYPVPSASKFLQYSTSQRERRLTKAQNTEGESTCSIMKALRVNSCAAERLLFELPIAVRFLFCVADTLFRFAERREIRARILF